MGSAKQADSLVVRRDHRKKMVVARSCPGIVVAVGGLEFARQLRCCPFYLHPFLAEDSEQMSDALIQLFAEILQIDPTDLNEDSSPDNVKQWDSLASMELVAAIEEKFKVKLSTKEIMKMSTIGRARKVLQG